MIPIPLILALAIGGGLIALLRRQHTPSALPPASPDAPDAPTPATNAGRDALVANTGSFKGELVRSPANDWRWTISGPSTTHGGDEDSGIAAVELVQTLGELSADTAFHGELQSRGAATIRWGVEAIPTGWGWSITRDGDASDPAGPPRPPIMVAHGVLASRPAAVYAALEGLSDYADWLDVHAGLEGSGAPVPTPTSLPGLAISGENVGITNLAAWLAYESPTVREQIEQGLEADEIINSVLGTMSDEARLNGHSIDWVRNTVSSLLDSIRAGTYLGTASPDDAVAAALVGANYSPADWWVSARNGYVLLVRPAKIAAGQFGIGGAGTRWRYSIWTGNARGYDEDVLQEVVTPAGKNRTQAIRLGKQAVDELNGVNKPIDNAIFIPPPEPTQTTWAGGQITNDTTYVPPIKTVQIPAVSWRDRKSVDVVVFDWKAGDNAKYPDWLFGFGICITVDSGSPFGALGGGANYDPDRWGIRNKPAPNAIGGTGVPITLLDFFQPTLYKAQYSARVLAGPKVQITEQLHTITGTGEGDQVDACPGRTGHWPEAAQTAGFNVWGPDNQVATWNPRPDVKLLIAGTRIVLRVTVSGMPVFVGAKGGRFLALDSLTRMELKVKTWGAGTR